MRILRFTKQGAHAPRSPISLALVLCLATISNARPPEIRAVNLRGLQIGGATTLTIDGADLALAPRISLDDKLLETTVDPASNANRLIVTVPVEASRPAGLGVLRVATGEGFSNSVVVGLDPFPQQPLADAIPALPATVHGSVPGGTVSRTSFTAKTGETVVIEVEARRIGSRLRPVVHVYDASRKELALARPSVLLSGDARAQVTIPADGQYTVELHDTQYAPPGPSFFRMRVGSWKCVDAAWPPVVPRGTSALVELFGPATPPVPATVPLRPEADLLAAVFPTPEFSGIPPTLRVSDLPEVLEPATAEPLTLGIPSGVCGRLMTPGEQDRYRLAVNPGAKLAFEVFAERLGSPVDAVLEVRNAQGAVLAQLDDTPTSIDPLLEFAVPAGIESVDLVIRNNLERSGPESFYRLVVVDAASVDKRMLAASATIRTDVANLPAGETQVLDVSVDRAGFDGPLQVALEGLPSGVTSSGTEIPAGTHGTLIVITNTQAAPAHVLTRLLLKSPDGTFARPVRFEAGPDDRTPRWARETLALATTPKPETAFTLTATETALPHLQMHSKAAVPVTIVRPSGTYGPVRLSLVTSQAIPKNGPQPNLALAVRLEQPNVEVPVAPPVKVAGDALATATKMHADAVQQAAAAQGDAKVAADAKVQEFAAKVQVAEAALKDAEAKAMYPSNLSVVVPSVLAEPSLDVAIKAELLTPERNVVLRTVYAPARRLTVVNPLSLTLAAATIEAPFDTKTGATVKIAGTITRLPGYTGPVTVTLTGLPPGLSAPAQALKPEDTTVAMELKVPANFAAAEIPNLKLTAAGPPDPLSGNQPVRAPEAGFTIKLLK